jgi:hypothetical protein
MFPENLSTQASGGLGPDWTGGADAPAQPAAVSTMSISRTIRMSYSSHIRENEGPGLSPD